MWPDAPNSTSRRHIPWREIAAFRNVLVHNYLGIDLDTVWMIVQRDLPPLERALIVMSEN
ncbi:MAG: DUF86 domain-containing protein [Candidatus Tectomicrobia bacterium]|nr:DUF86 domain-containing protein [Candidatus Tectomicrobia bacterium]